MEIKKLERRNRRRPRRDETTTQEEKGEKSEEHGKGDGLGGNLAFQENPAQGPQESLDHRCHES